MQNIVCGAPVRLRLFCPGRRRIVTNIHDDVIKWKHFPRYWLFVRGIHRGPHKSQWRGALMFSLICVWINGWVNNRKAADLRRYRAHYDVIVMTFRRNKHIVWKYYHCAIAGDCIVCTACTNKCLTEAFFCQMYSAHLTHSCQAYFFLLSLSTQHAPHNILLDINISLIPNELFVQYVPEYTCKLPNMDG